MSADPPEGPPARSPDRSAPPERHDGIAWPPVCDELSGGGGSATDTRDRALRGGRPGGLKDDCARAPLPRPGRPPE